MNFIGVKITVIKTGAQKNLVDNENPVLALFHCCEL